MTEMRRTKNRELEKRHRNVAHLWADKRLIRFFRKNFNQKDYKNLRSVYLALCEIESDFGEHAQIYSFTKTVATYAGMSEDTIRLYLKALMKADIIDYWQENIDGRFGNTTLLLFKWEDWQEEEKLESLRKTLKYRSRKNPATVNPGYGFSGSFKNTSKDVNMYKNSKESIGKKRSQEKSFLEEFPKDWQENESFQNSLQDYEIHRKQKGNKLTKIARARLVNKLTQHDVNTITNALQRSVECGWTGVFPESESPPTKQSDATTIQANFESALKSLAGKGRQKIEDLLSLNNGRKGDPELKNEYLFNATKIHDWLTSKQQRPEEEKLKEWWAEGGSDYDKAYKWIRSIPSPATLTLRYLSWLLDQHWLHDYTPKLLSPDHKLFYRFLAKQRDRTGYDVLTGKRTES